MPQIIPEKIPCHSIQEFLTEVSSFKDVMDLEETEETWDRIERGLARFSAVIKGGGYQFKKELVDALKILPRPMISALNSERTRLSAAVLDCIGVVAPRIGLDFEPLVPIYIPPILRLSNRTNKVYVVRSQATIALIIGFCHIPSILSCLLTACKESKIATGRTAAVEGVLRALTKWDWSPKEFQNRITTVEEIIRITGRDKDASIRQVSRQIFETYKNLFPERVDEFIAPLTPVMRKYLEIKAEERGRPVAKMTLTTSTTSAPAVEPNALGLNVPSTNSRRVGEQPSAPKSKSTRTRPVITSTQTMPPPSTVPNKDTARSRSPSCPRSQEDTGDQERKRLLSSISSTFSVKSVPPSSKPLIDRQPPIRLATSQTRSVSVTRPALTSTGPARRIRRVVSIEQTNRPDLFAMAKKAATRSISQTKDQSSFGGKSTVNTGGVSFPTSDPRSFGIERRGAQRVPKPLPFPAAPSENREEIVSANASEPSAPAIPIPKRETKPSLFRRAVSADERKDQKAEGGFAPRRGGLLQPTLSQLNKQKPPVSMVQSRSRVVSQAGPKRSGTQKITKIISSGPVAKPVAPVAGESSQIQIVEGTNDQITDSPVVTGPEGNAQIVDDAMESKPEADDPRVEIEPGPAPVQKSEGEALAIEDKVIQNGPTMSQAEEEIRSRESTPAPQTPSSSVINKETSKAEWQNIELVSEVVPAANSISITAKVVTTIPESNKSSDPIPLVDALMTG